MGRRYSPSGRFLPIFFITQFLEKVSCYMGWPQKGWVVQLLLDIGVPYITVLSTYDQIYQARDEFWDQLEQPLYLITIQRVIFELFLQKPTIVPANEKRLFVDKCLQVQLHQLLKCATVEPGKSSRTVLLGPNRLAGRDFMSESPPK